MFWEILLQVAIAFLLIVVGILIGRRYIIDGYKIGVYDVANNELYYDRDEDPKHLEELKQEIGVVDLVYLSKDRKAGKDFGKLS